MGRLLASVMIAGSSTPESVRLQLVLPGAAPRLRSFDVVALNGYCEHCHQDIAAE